MTDTRSNATSSRETVLRNELTRLLQWFRDREDRSGHKAQIIHIGMALDEAARSETSAPVDRNEIIEECAKRCDDLAFCEECHDCLDDLTRSAPYRRAAKTIRALKTQAAGPAPVSAIQGTPRYDALEARCKEWDEACSIGLPPRLDATDKLICDLLSTVFDLEGELAELKAQRSAIEEPETCWLIERQIDGRAHWWTGGHSEHFDSDPQQAIRFSRERDAFWVARACVRHPYMLTEHVFIGKEDKHMELSEKVGCFKWCGDESCMPPNGCKKVASPDSRSDK